MDFATNVPMDERPEAVRMFSCQVVPPLSSERPARHTTGMDELRFEGYLRTGRVEYGECEIDLHLVKLCVP